MGLPDRPEINYVVYDSRNSLSANIDLDMTNKPIQYKASVSNKLRDLYEKRLIISEHLEKAMSLYDSVKIKIMTAETAIDKKISESISKICYEVVRNLAENYQLVNSLFLNTEEELIDLNMPVKSNLFLGWHKVQSEQLTLNRDECQREKLSKSIEINQILKNRKIRSSLTSELHSKHRLSSFTFQKQKTSILKVAECPSPQSKKNKVAIRQVNESIIKRAIEETN